VPTNNTPANAAAMLIFFSDRTTSSIRALKFISTNTGTGPVVETKSIPRSVSHAEHYRP
jgi:hypothetical protein